MVSDDSQPGDEKETSRNERARGYLADSQLPSIEYLRQQSFLYMQDGFSIVDANGLHVDVNPAFCAMTGFSVEEIIGRSPEHCYWPPEEREKIRIVFERTLDGKFAEVELIFMRKNGERFPVLVVPFAIRDERDELVFFAATVKDITQRLQADDALRNSEIRYRKLFESAGDAIAILQDEKIIEYNKRTTDLYGYSHDEVLSTPAVDFFPPNQPNGQGSREFFREKVSASRTGDPQVFEWSGQSSDGRAIHTEVTLTSFTIDGKQYTQSIGRDITRRKNAEAELVDINKTLEDRVAQRTEELETAYAELLQRNVRYRELAKRLTQAEEQERKRIAQLLHDNHQQLLVAAKFRLEMLQGGSHDPDVHSAAREVLEILDQAVEITRSLTMELAPPVLSGAGLVVALQLLARRMEEEHQMEIVVQGALPSMPVSTEIGDVLVRAIRELLFNVVKHSGVRQARVCLALAEQWLVLTVEDEGVGFNVAGTLELEGTYGLFSIQEQLHSLDGRLNISSAPQRGTICTVSVPMDAAEISTSEVLPAVEKTIIETTGKRRAERGSIRILVADDHVVARQALVQILSLAEGFVVVGEAVDGLDVIQKSRMLLPDIIVMDVSMPQLNGIEATRAIMNELSGVKIIGFSMDSSEEMESRMLAAGAIGYLQKLTTVEKLFATIRGAMGE